VPYFGKKTCFQRRIKQKKHIYSLICALLVRGELMHHEAEEEWEEDEEKNWLDEEW